MSLGAFAMRCAAARVPPIHGDSLPPLRRSHTSAKSGRSASYALGHDAPGYTSTAASRARISAIRWSVGAWGRERAGFCSLMAASEVQQLARLQPSRGSTDLTTLDTFRSL